MPVKWAEWVKRESVVILYVANVAVALLVSWGLKLTPAQVGAVTTITSALVTIITAFAVRPVTVPLIKGAATTLLVAFSAFGLHLSTSQIGYSTAALSIIVGLLLRQNVTPAAQAKTATAKAAL